MWRTRSHNFTIYSVDVDTRSHNWFGVAARGNCDTDCTVARGHWHTEIPGNNGGVEGEMNFYCFHHFHRYHSTWLLYHYRSCTHRHEERIPHTTHDPGLGSEDVTLPTPTRGEARGQSCWWVIRITDYLHTSNKHQTRWRQMCCPLLLFWGKEATCKNYYHDINNIYNTSTSE